MGQIPPDKPLEEIDREAIAIWKTRRDSGLPSYPSERVDRFIADLERRLDESGTADPKIAEELLAELRKETGQ
jgi:hypothetical protein